MKSRIGTICLAILFITSANAQESFGVQVFVENFDNVPIQNAEVELYDMNDTYRFGGTTDFDGTFDMTINPGQYRIKLFMDGKLKKNKIINLPKLEGRRFYNRVRIFVLYEEREKFTLENLLFEYNSAHIYEESYPILNKLVDYLLNEGDSKFEIGGHTDAIGTDEDNLILSRNRAKAVKAYLVAHGVAEERIVAVGYGESVPVADNETDEGRAKNRRTEVKKLD